MQLVAFDMYYFIKLTSAHIQNIVRPTLIKSNHNYFQLFENSYFVKNIKG